MLNQRKSAGRLYEEHVPHSHATDRVDGQVTADTWPACTHVTPGVLDRTAMSDAAAAIRSASWRRDAPRSASGQFTLLI
jgi:hypothetical protein